ncbi:MAG: hypothetical protein JXB03_11770 [Spirochaetales bacterium]|nr:hypothetical protein [Spirochaetales bacterium]
MNKRARHTFLRLLDSLGVCAVLLLIQSCSYFVVPSPLRINTQDAGSSFYGFKAVALDTNQVVLAWHRNNLDGSLLFFRNYADTTGALVESAHVATVHSNDSGYYVLDDGVVPQPGMFYSAYVEYDEAGVTQRNYLQGATPQFGLKHHYFSLPVTDVFSSDNSFSQVSSAVNVMSEGQILRMDFGLEDCGFGTMAQAELVVYISASSDLYFRVFAVDERMFEGRAWDYQELVNNMYSSAEGYSPAGASSVTVDVSTLFSDMFAYHHRLYDSWFMPSVYLLCLVEQSGGGSAEIYNEAGSEITLVTEFYGYLRDEDPLYEEE